MFNIYLIHLILLQLNCFVASFCLTNQFKQLDINWKSKCVRKLIQNYNRTKKTNIREATKKITEAFLSFPIHSTGHILSSFPTKGTRSYNCHNLTIIPTKAILNFNENICKIL